MEPDTKDRTSRLGWHLANLPKYEILVFIFFFPLVFSCSFQSPASRGSAQEGTRKTSSRTPRYRVLRVWTFCIGSTRRCESRGVSMSLTSAYSRCIVVNDEDAIYFFCILRDLSSFTLTFRWLSQKRVSIFIVSSCVRMFCEEARKGEIFMWKWWGYFLPSWWMLH